MKKIALLLIALSLVVWAGCATVPKSSPINWDSSISDYQHNLMMDKLRST